WVIFPHMIPSFFAGMRLGMTGVLLGVLLAELYVSTAGIGYFTTLFTQSFNPTKLLGLISVLAAMAIALNEIVRRAELRYSHWRHARRRRTADVVDEVVGALTAEMGTEAHHHRFRYDRAVGHVEVAPHASGVDLQACEQIAALRQRARRQKENLRQRDPLDLP